MLYSEEPNMDPQKMCLYLIELKMDGCQINPKDIYGVVVSPPHRFQWEMKISKWCSSSISSR